MTQFSEQDLCNLLTKARSMILVDETVPPAALSKEEQEIIKRYIPMQLNEDSAKKMMDMVNDIREGSRSPMNDQERLELNQKNMEESLINFLSRLRTADDDEFDSMCQMCECIRKSRSSE